MVSGSCFVYGSCVAFMLVRCVVSSICDLGFWGFRVGTKSFVNCLGSRMFRAAERSSVKASVEVCSLPVLAASTAMIHFRII